MSDYDSSALLEIKGVRSSFPFRGAITQALNGVTVDIAGALVRHRDELTASGWDVRLLDGPDHAGAMQPGAAMPLVRAWLDGLRQGR